jgi:hypothetical protein
MQNDLISRTEVLKLIEDIKCDDNVPKNYGTLLDLIRMIRNLPAAYDVEFVENELYKRFTECYNNGSLGALSVAFDEAMSIVRNGGKE